MGPMTRFIATLSSLALVLVAYLAMALPVAACDCMALEPMSAYVGSPERVIFSGTVQTPEPNGTPVLVCGRRVPTAGRVSMDMLTVDLTGVPDAQVGTDVVLWGEGLPVDDVAMAASTVGYELLCAVAPRVPFAVRER